MASFLLVDQGKIISMLRNQAPSKWRVIEASLSRLAIKAAQGLSPLKYHDKSKEGSPRSQN